jgi:NADPH:quinone reductase-like Zn-dependent oxidoreductase
VVFLTAWHCLISVAKAKPGESVLVHAAGSGCGVAAIQVAKYLGLQLLTTAGSDAKLEKAKDLGADEGSTIEQRHFRRRPCA